MALVNTDIYNIMQSVSDLRSRYIDNESEDTLAVGIYGYIGDLEAKKIQTGIMMTGELANEVFPTKAKLDKNIITHAINQNITDINATPSNMTVVIGILQSDLDKYMVNNTFIFDKNCPIIIGDSNENNYEFHLDYDIILTRSESSSSQQPVYAAVYDMSVDNRISPIDNPYLNQPYIMNINNISTYVFFQCTIRQVEYTEKYTQIVSSSIIDNKTTTFEFENQLTDFEVIVTDGDKTYNLVPIFEGSGIDADVEYYCNYNYVNDNTVRIKFERSSYMPRLNAEIRIVIKTTQGYGGNFEYSESTYCSFESDTHGYKDVTLMITPSTNSIGGIDKKSVKELQSILPKEILSRGMISTETDLNNYFNLLNTETERLIPYKKVDNQIERIYYEYFLIKNSDGNVIPTNTVVLNIDKKFLSTFGEGESLVLPAGSIIKYSDQSFEGEIIEVADDSKYIYASLYTMVINKDPLFCAMYLTIVNEDSYCSFNYINQKSKLQFIPNRTHFERRLLSERNKYKLTLQETQNINTDMGMLILDEEGKVVITNNMRVIIVLYKEGTPYRYKDATLTGWDLNYYQYDWMFEFETDNAFDNSNRMKILNLKTVGSGDDNYGYLDDSTEAYIYSLAKFDSSYGTYDLEDIVPDLAGYTVTNKYQIEGNLNFFINYSGVMNNRIDVSGDIYNITGVPVVGLSYIRDEDKLFDFITQMNYKKLYMDEALYILENAFDIDFKFFNTYGPSRNYTVDDEKDEGKISIGRTDIDLRFRLSLKSSSDLNTKDSIVADIKEYIESLDMVNDMHIPNMMSDLREKYKTTINYLEFLGFNNFDANYQHMYKQYVEDVNIPPEFINVRNELDLDGNYVPCISIEIATSSTTS